MLEDRTTSINKRLYDNERVELEAKHLSKIFSTDKIASFDFRIQQIAWKILLSKIITLNSTGHRSMGNKIKNSEHFLSFEIEVDQLYWGLRKHVHTKIDNLRKKKFEMLLRIKTQMMEWRLICWLHKLSRVLFSAGHGEVQSPSHLHFTRLWKCSETSHRVKSEILWRDLALLMIAIMQETAYLHQIVTETSITYIK